MNRRLTKGARYREILVVLARRGIGVVDDELIKHEAGDRARAANLRLACEELGTMFIKLGQVLSTRGDLLPQVYRAELAKLQSDVPPLPERVIVDVIREDLEAPLDTIFASFDKNPLGSASIGQVHAARLYDGREVVVKVRKPGVAELVQIDLAILASLVDKWSPRFPMLEDYEARGLVAEFRDTRRADLDFARETAKVQPFRDLFKNELGFKIPEVINEYSKDRVVTEERIKGRNASNVADLPKPRRATISQRIVRFVLEPAFKRGVFHADPHPGNLLIQEDDTLCVLDFGKVGRLTPEQRRNLAGLFIAIGECDADRLTDHLIQITGPTQPIDRALLMSEVDRMLQHYASAALTAVHVGDALGDLLELSRRNRLRLPGNLVQFFKTLAMCEGLLLKLYPESSFSDYLRPMAGMFLLQEFTGGKTTEQLRDSALDLAEFASNLPRRLDRILGEVERGNLRIYTRIEDVEPIVKRLERLAARANAAILVAGCIVGLALVIPFYHPQGLKVWIGVVFWIAVGAVVAGAARTLWRLGK
jgi:ubiquinone biosynthesis protein